MWKTGTAARFDEPWGIAVDADNNVIVADRGNHLIRKVTPAGAVTTLAAGNSTSMREPSGVAIDKTGDVWVTFAGANTVHRINRSGTMALIAASRSRAHRGTIARVMLVMETPEQHGTCHRAPLAKRARSLSRRSGPLRGALDGDAQLARQPRRLRRAFVARGARQRRPLPRACRSRSAART